MFWEVFFLDFAGTSSVFANCFLLFSVFFIALPFTACLLLFLRVSWFLVILLFYIVVNKINLRPTAQHNNTICHSAFGNLTCCSRCVVFNLSKY
jgi:hypothetical protein